MFVDSVRINRAKTDTLENAIDMAIAELQDDSLIKPFLIANKAEVKFMCLTEYDEARTLAEQKEDGIEIGIEIGEARGEVKGAIKTLVGLVQDGILSIVEAAKRSNMPVAEFSAKTGLSLNNA